MKLHEHERARPNLAGLASPGQQAELKLLLAGGWPPLKPLPVFKYETHEYRASIDFDKTRGEWVCRKTFLLSNKVQELRGGLPEILRTLPHCQVEVLAGRAAAEQQDQELDKDATRRLQAMLEWRENFENGALYSALREFLSTSQQAEIEQSLRLTLTARQLQCSPKNISYVFDALLKAGGKLATLMEIAQRNKTGQGSGVPTPTEEEAEAPETEYPAPVKSLIPATLESFAKEPIGNAFPEQDQPAPLEPLAFTASQQFEFATPEILDADLPLFTEDLPDKVEHPAPVSSLASRVRRTKVAFPVDNNSNSPARKHGLEISGLQLAAFAFLFLFAVISLPVGLTVGRGPIGNWLQDAEKSILPVDATSPAPPVRHDEATSRSTSAPAPNTITDLNGSPVPNKPDDATTSVEKPTESARNSEAFAKAPSTNVNSSPAIEAAPPDNPEPSPVRNSSAGLVPRIAPSPANPKPLHSAKVVGSTIGAPRNPIARKLTPPIGAAPHAAPPSAIFVTLPARGGKPFRVAFPEKPIAASSSTAMSSELSVLVSPQPGPAAAHKPARLQAGELVYFVWPHFSRAGDRYGAAETVKVRTTVGPLGQVLDVKLVNGSPSLLPAATSAIRQWRYKPTLLNKSPVQVQQDVTIEFRPSQYLSQVRTQTPSQK
jgi:hypothetical protein